MPSKIRLRYLFKSRFLVKSIAKLFHKMGLKPNSVTYLMVLFSIIGFFIILCTSNVMIFGIFVFLSLIMDGADGALARMTEQVTSAGGFLDSVFDRISEVIIIISLAFGSLHLWIFPLVVVRIIYFVMLLFSVMISYVRSRASTRNTKEMDIGLFARSERLFTVFILCLIPIPIIFSVGMTLLTIGIIGTAGYRFSKYGKMLQKNEKLGKMDKNR